VSANGTVYLYFSASPLPGNTTFDIEEAIATGQTLATLESSNETTPFIPGDIFITPSIDSNVTPNNPYSVIVTAANGTTPVFEIDSSNIITRVNNELLLSQPSGSNGTNVSLLFQAPGNTGAYAGGFTSNWRNMVFTMPFNGIGNGWHLNNGTNDVIYADSSDPFWVYNTGTNGSNSTINFGTPGATTVSPGGSTGRGQIASNWREFVITTPFTGSGHGFHINNGSADIAYVDSSTGSLTLSGSISVGSSRKGTFVCTAAGTITISNTNELATSDVIISLNTAGGTISTAPAMKTVTGGTGFTVLCGAADTSTYNYDILN
jgi:hypothetical protein